MAIEKVNIGEYVGIGWENKGGIVISIKKDDLLKMNCDNYGSIKLFVGRRKEVDERSKASHFVKKDVSAR